MFSFFRVRSVEITAAMLKAVREAGKKRSTTRLKKAIKKRLSRPGLYKVIPFPSDSTPVQTRRELINNIVYPWGSKKAQELVKFAKTGGPVIVDDFYEHDYTVKDGVVKVIPLPWRSPHNRKNLSLIMQHTPPDRVLFGETIAKAMEKPRPARVKLRVYKPIGMPTNKFKKELRKAEIRNFSLRTKSIYTPGPNAPLNALFALVEPHAKPRA